MERDYVILKEIGRWRCVLGRHIKELAGFEGIRACDRRLKILIDNNYIKRQKVLYGFPYVYTLTHKSRILLNLNKREDVIRIDKARHDSIVLDVVIWLMKEKKLNLSDFQSEKELHQDDGFSIRKHKPDFLFNHNNEIHAVEIELSLKSYKNLEKNVSSNYLEYKKQIWFVERSGGNKIYDNLKKLQEEMSDIQIIYIEDIL